MPVTNELEQDRRTYFLDLAEEDWENCWPPEPAQQVSKFTQRTLDEHNLIKAFANIVNGYDGHLSDLANHLADFRGLWIEMRADKLEQEAEEDTRQAQMDAAADRDLFDREEW